MSEDRHKLHLGWDKVTSMVIETKKQIDIIRSQMGFVRNPKYIIGISRGGLIPAVMLSHLYSRRNIQVIHASSYDDNDKQHDLNVFVDGMAQEACRSSDAVIVDDIIDSGKTMDLIKLTWPKPIFAAIATKQIVPGVACGSAFPMNSWIVFPWESNL